MAERVIMDTRIGAEIEITSVSKTFPSRSAKGEDVVVLDNISISVPAGQFVAVVGPSGCGKSTLLNMVAGLDSTSAGAVVVDGKRMLAPRSDVGVVFQEYALFPWMTVRGNIGFGLREAKVSKTETRTRVDALIEMAGLVGFDNHYPSQLSGGMRQRCALARTLANEPRALLMDEPLGAVDAQTRATLQGEILRIWGEEADISERRTVLFITHDIDEAVFLSDRIIVLSRNPGQVKADITNPLPRPRLGHRHSPELAKLSQEVWDLI